MPFRRAQYVSLKILRFIVNSRGLWIRAIICWLVGVVVLFIDDPAQFDRRFALRGWQPIDPEIVLLQFTVSDWREVNGLNPHAPRPMREFLSVSDSFFWNPQTWSFLLNRIIADQPRALAVTLFFSSELFADRPSRKEAPIFSDDRILWAANQDHFGHVMMPFFSNSYGYNAGIAELPLDDDQRVRRFSSPLVQIPHLAYRLGEDLGVRDLQADLPFGDSKLINFRGPAQTFPTVTLPQVLRGQVPAGFFNRKIVVIGVADSDSHVFQTPLGTMTRAEIYANIIDNMLNHRWIKPVPYTLVLLYLLIVVVLTVWILFQYPQLVAWSALAALSLAMGTLSLFLFDQTYYWLPLFAPMASLFATYIVFVSYQLTLTENLTWRLEQERKNLLELEAMKGNFVSLISHDLKTPIAKIQAICDRLIHGKAKEDGGSTIAQDALKSIRRESTELHRYIQSILKISHVESNSLKLQRDATDLNELVEHVRDLLMPLADEKNLSFQLELEPLFSIEVDGALIQEVILNLVENAIKYSPPNSTILIKTEEHGNSVRLTVTDNGPGVAEDELDRIFNKFYRGRDHSLTTKGTGLGLYLVKFFVELHGGSVFADRHLNEGFSIGFKIPLEPT